MVDIYQNSPFIIAEAGVNHNGSLKIAKEMIDIAKACNVDAIKFQTFTANEVVTKSAPKAEYQKISSTGKTQYEMISELELSREDFIELKKYCDTVGLLFLSTPFDLESLDFLVEELHIPIIKISSGEITNAPLLYRSAKHGKKIILSTGMSTIPEIQEALGVLAFGYIEKTDIPSLKKFKAAFHSGIGQERLKENVTLLHCTSAYPTPYHDVNLKAIQNMRDTFLLKVGYSDHTLGIYASIGAVCYGATVIEKHFTLDKNLIGPDHSSSLDPYELSELVSALRIIKSCQGSNYKGPTESEKGNISICRRSLVAKTPITKGEQFSDKTLCAKRPGLGISPMFYWEWLEKYAHKNFEDDEIIS